MRARIVSLEGRAELLEGVRRCLEERLEIVWAYLHGSFHEGPAARDIDIAVWLDPERVPAAEWRRYELDLAASLHVRIRYPVDVRALNDAAPAFRYHALRGEPLVVRDRDHLDEVRARTWDEYFDFLPAARQYLREVLDV